MCLSYLFWLLSVFLVFFFVFNLFWCYASFAFFRLFVSCNHRTVLDLCTLHQCSLVGSVNRSTVHSRLCDPETSTFDACMPDLIDLTVTLARPLTWRQSTSVDPWAHGNWPTIVMPSVQTASTIPPFSPMFFLFLLWLLPSSQRFNHRTLGTSPNFFDHHILLLQIILFGVNLMATYRLALFRGFDTDQLAQDFSFLCSERLTT